MPQHMVAFAQAGGFAAAGSLEAVLPVPDPTVTINGNLSYVPDKYNKVVYAGAADGAGFTTRLQLQSPSLRELWYPEVTPLSPNVAFPATGLYMDWSDSPLPLVTSEGLQAFILASAAGANPIVGVIYGDDKKAPTTGKIWSMRATATPTLVFGQWVNAALTFDQPLPVGDYDVVGMRVDGTGIVLARLVFIGPSAITRPGVFCQTAFTDQGDKQFRSGYNGVMGTFNNITPPSIDFLGTAGATTANVTLDLVQR